MTLKSDRKFEEKLTLNSKNDMRNLVNFNAGSEVRKICTLMCYFCRKYIMFEPKKYRGIMCHNTEEWCKYVSSLDYHPRSSKLASRIHLFIFTWTPQGFICLSVCLPVSFCLSVCLSVSVSVSLSLSLYRILVEFSPSNFYMPPCMAKIFKFMEFTFLENALIWGIFTRITPHSKLAPNFLSSRPRQKKVTHSPRQHSFENLFPPTAEKGERNYDLLYQNSVRKYEDDLEH